MDRDQYHLRTVLEHFDIRNKSVAAALNVHPSMITKWLTHDRLIGMKSKYLEPLAEYILSRASSAADMTWLEKRFRDYGIKGALASVTELKTALMIWLVSDPNDDPSGLMDLTAGTDRPRADSSQYSAKFGVADISFCLSFSLSQLEPGSAVRISLSDESLLLRDVFLHTIRNTAEAFGLRFQVLLTTSGRSGSPAKAINAFLPLIIDGSMSIAVAYREPALSVDEAAVVMPEYAAMVITTLPDSPAPPAALLIHEKTFVRDLSRRIGETFSRSQPLLASPERSSRQQVQTLLRQCYESTGALAVLRDGLNPLVLTEDAFGAYLKRCGYEGEAYDWRIDEFRRRKEAFDGSLKRGMTLRELVPLSLLDDAVTNEVCTISGEDFLEPGPVMIGCQTCADLLEGYTRYLNLYPDFSLRFIGALPEVFKDSLCMVKGNSQVLVAKRRQDDTEAYAVSQQMTFVQSVSQIFEQLWEGLDYVTHRGETTLQTMQRYILRIMAKAQGS
jgi:hypothetical protein